MRPRRPKPDANQAEIVRDLRRLGFVVHDVSSLGGECLDLFVGGYCYRQDEYVWLQCEVKTADGKLTRKEAAYLSTFDPLYPVLEVRCTEDVVRWFGEETQ